MPRQFYCSVCLLPLKYKRKGFPNYGRILDLIEPHECPGVPQELDFKKTEKPQPIPSAEVVTEPQIVQKLDELMDDEKTIFSDRTLVDRRPQEQVKSTAPKSILKAIDEMNPSIPAHGDTEPAEE